MPVISRNGSEEPYRRSRPDVNITATWRPSAPGSRWLGGDGRGYRPSSSLMSPLSNQAARLLRQTCLRRPECRCGRRAGWRCCRGRSCAVKLSKVSNRLSSLRSRLEACQTIKSPLFRKCNFSNGNIDVLKLPLFHSNHPLFQGALPASTHFLRQSIGQSL